MYLRCLELLIFDIKVHLVHRGAQMDKILLSRAFFVNSQGDLLHMEKSFPLKRDLPNLKARSKFIGEIIFHVGTILVTLVYQIIVSAHLFISIHFPPLRFLFGKALYT